MRFRLECLVVVVGTVLIYQAFDAYCIQKADNLFENRLSDKFNFLIFVHVVVFSKNKLTTWG
jgi:hypothetical protein